MPAILASAPRCKQQRWLEDLSGLPKVDSERQVATYRQLPVFLCASRAALLYTIRDSLLFLANLWGAGVTA